MSLARGRLDFGGNDVRAQGPGDSFLEQVIIAPVTVAGSTPLTAQQILSGAISRTGPGGAYNDTFPSADSIMQAMPTLMVGDSFKLNFINTVAFTNGLAVGEGGVLGANTNMVASSVRQFLFTILGDGSRQSFNCVTTNGSPVITGLDAIAIGLVRPGQGITGTGIPGSAFITAVNPITRTITINGNATATGVPAVTTFPRYRVDGVFSATL